MKDIFSYNKKVGNRTLEVHLIYTRWTNLFGITLETIFTGSDHAGPRLELMLVGLIFMISLPRNGHWDDETNTWTKYNDTE